MNRLRWQLAEDEGQLRRLIAHAAQFETPRNVAKVAAALSERDRRRRDIDAHECEAVA
jgi:hypothetical protein